MIQRDCNTCANHKQGQHPPLDCRVCLAAPRNLLPNWRPKTMLSLAPKGADLTETIELSDVSPHAVVSDYKPPCKNNQTCDCGPFRCKGASSTSGACKAALPFTPGAVISMSKVAQAIPVKDANPTPLAGRAKTYDDGKAPLAVLPWAALDEMAHVMAYGHKKYGDYNNYRKGMEVSRNLSCAMRHIRDFMSGKDTDAESKRSHLGHALCRIAYVLQNIADGTVIDDRYKAGQK